MAGFFMECTSCGFNIQIRARNATLNVYTKFPQYNWVLVQCEKCGNPSSSFLDEPTLRSMLKLKLPIITEEEVDPELIIEFNRVHGINPHDLSRFETQEVEFFHFLLDRVEGPDDVEEWHGKA